MTPDFRRYVLAAVALAMAATPALAQRTSLGRDRRDDCDSGSRRLERFCDERVIGWRGNTGTISADASPNGGITVTGWDRDSVEVTITVNAQAETMEEARALAAQVQVTSQGGILRATGPTNRRSANWWVMYDLYVPRRTDLTLETVNGPLTVDDVSGVLDLQTENGPISLDNVGGNVRARLQNGPLSVSLRGSSWQGQGLDASTQNGPVVLRVPENYNAELETGTINGPMNIGFPITVQGRFGGGNQRIRTTLGRGGPSVRVVTTNGPAVINRGMR
jgi:DUF4097 and DUF4098 domain-containing protein YvlB